MFFGTEQLKVLDATLLSLFDEFVDSFVSFVVTKVLPETPSRCCFLVDPFVSALRSAVLIFLCCVDYCLLFNRKETRLVLEGSVTSCIPRNMISYHTSFLSYFCLFLSVTIHIVFGS